MSKCAALLINLGSPASTSVADVKRYLHEFLTDPRVIDKPFVRKYVVPGIILQTRPKKSAEAYASIWTEEGSPLVAVSEKQRKLCDEQLDLPVYLAMRYGEPAIKETLEQIAADGIEKLFVLPLYPQYAMSSYETVVVAVTEAVKEHKIALDCDFLQPFYNDPEYLGILARSIQSALPDDFDKLVFSFHGIPERHLKVSDPSHAHCLCVEDCCRKANPAHATCYRHQCVSVVDSVVKQLGLREDQYFLSFQSRLGREPWLTPFTDKTLGEMGASGVKKLRIVCPAFVTDCLETLEEIAEEGKEIFIEAGGEDFALIPCLNDHPEWIGWMVQRIRTWAETKA